VKCGQGIAPASWPADHQVQRPHFRAPGLPPRLVPPYLCSSARSPLPGRAESTLTLAGEDRDAFMTTRPAAIAAAAERLFPAAASGDHLHSWRDQLREPAQGLIRSADATAAGLNQHTASPPPSPSSRASWSSPQRQPRDAG
jgi:hypothetical protein